LQFKRGLLPPLIDGQPTIRRCELHADFFSGYFAGVRKKDKPDYPAAVFVVTLSSLMADGNYQRITVRLKNALLLSFAVSKLLIVNGDHWMMQSISACNTSLLSSRSLRYLFGIHFLTSSRDEQSDRVRCGSASAYIFPAHAGDLPYVCFAQTQRQES